MDGEGKVMLEVEVFVARESMMRMELGLVIGEARTEESEGRRVAVREESEGGGGEVGGGHDSET
jgi:hypothetical protein